MEKPSSHTLGVDRSVAVVSMKLQGEGPGASIATLPNEIKRGGAVGAAKQLAIAARTAQQLMSEASRLARELAVWESGESRWGQRLEEYHAEVVYMPEGARWSTAHPLRAEEELSEEERKRLDEIEKWSPLPLHDFTGWVELGILTEEEAEDFRQGFGLNYTGNRTAQEGPEHYGSLPPNADPEELQKEWERMFWRRATTKAVRGMAAKVSPALAVVTAKGDGWKTRLCLDPTKNLNDRCVVPKFWMPLVLAFASSLRGGWYMYGDDLIDAFLLYSLRDEDIPLVGISNPVDPDEIALLRVWIFGLGGAPEVYNRASTKVDDFWWSKVKPWAFMRFCDDSSGGHPSYTGALNEQGLFERLNVRLNRRWSRTKRELPTQDRKTLGRGVRTVHSTMRNDREVQIYVTPKRREDTRAAIAEARGKQQLNPRHACHIFGMLNFITSEVRGGASHCRHLLGAFKGFTVDWQAGVLIGPYSTRPMQITREMRSELAWWDERLKTDSCMRTITSQLDALITVIGADASTSSGGGGVCYITASPEEHVQRSEQPALAPGSQPKTSQLNWSIDTDSDDEAAITAVIDELLDEMEEKDADERGKNNKKKDGKEDD